MKRYTIHAMVSFDVNAEDPVEAFQNLADALGDVADHGPIRDFTVQHTETIEVPFVIPPGAERWAAAASFRMGEQRGEHAPFPMHDGSWWWTDGHAALRCEGPMPEGRKAIPGDPLGDSSPNKPRDTVWGPPRKSQKADDITLCIASHNDELAIQEKYRSLIESTVPGVKWVSGGEREPAVAYDDKQVVAFVMPCRVQ